MADHDPAFGLETKFCGFEGAPALAQGTRIAGYASLFGLSDRGGDIVARGAYADSLARLSAEGRKIKMLWQHDPARPIGVWTRVREDEKGLYVEGNLLADVQGGREAAALLMAGAIDGLSIGYRTLRAEKSGSGRILREVDLWEVSLVTFPMLPQARIGEGAADAAAAAPDDSFARDVSAAIAEARQALL